MMPEEQRRHINDPGDTWGALISEDFGKIVEKLRSGRNGEIAILGINPLLQKGTRKNFTTWSFCNRGTI